jgi:cardiolipin synthase
MNFDNRSMALNDEATLIVLDRTAGQNMDRIFFDDVRHAEEITLDAFMRRSWFQRVAESGANFVARFALIEPGL